MSLNEFQANNIFKINLIFCGDININLYDNLTETNVYNNKLAKYGFTSVLNNFNRVTQTSLLPMYRSYIY